MLTLTFLFHMAVMQQRLHVTIMLWVPHQLHSGYIHCRVPINSFIKVSYDTLQVGERERRREMKEKERKRERKREKESTFLVVRRSEIELEEAKTKDRG